MAYQLDYFAVIKAFFMPFNLFFLLLFLGPVAIAVFVAYRTINRYRIAILLASVAIPILILSLISFPEVGSGWNLDRNSLKIKSPPVLTTIQLPEARVELVESSGSWQTTLRINGSGKPGLAIGWFKLQNGKKAVVFRHLHHAKMVVLEYQGEFYILQHPGVEDLYMELIARGAKPTGL
ncbi:PH domain-containing protein [Desulfoscipio sp. XC116]|uniref:PH domain-containing protein n=1 Tax=Desulfoscipio sp. XC116 TaxID=3144975 RepID=UPI00325A912F